LKRGYGRKQYVSRGEYDITIFKFEKKNQACNFHCVREAIAAEIVQFRHIDSEVNVTDVCTKPLPAHAHHSVLKEYMYRQPKAIEEQPRQDTTELNIVVKANQVWNDTYEGY